ncbi:MAG: hypothetical protein OXK80_02825 [Bdellovibrionales bacterium]|nr:hypothetical protein [Bdellovibrionales bacterium]
MSKYSYSAQMRADLAGGTLDIWPFYLMVENSVTIQLALSLKCSSSLVVNKNSNRIVLKTGGQSFEYNSLKDFLDVKDEKFALLQSIVRHFKPSSGFQLEWSSDSPQGGGLGASSCLAVLWINCFSKWLKHKLDFYELLYLCRDLEAQAMGTFAGFQDYIIPLQSISESLKVKKFINIIYWSALKPRIATLELLKSMKENLVLIDTGISHHSGRSNWRGIQSYLEGSDFLVQCRDIALDMAKACREENFQKWPELFNRECVLRKKFHKGYIPKEMEEMQKTWFASAGVKAFKMMGAGGGGCALLWTEHPQKTLKVCAEKNIRVLTISDV